MFLSIIIRLSLSYFPFQEPIVEGTMDNWVSEVTDVVQKQVCLVMFMQQRNSACKSAIPEFQEAANSSLGMIKFLSVDVKQYPKIAHLYTVRAVPAFRIIHSKGVEEYSDEISAPYLVAAAQKFIISRASPIDASWAPSPTTPTSIILLTTKKNIPPYFSAISSLYSDTKIRIGYSRNNQLWSLFGATDPTSIVFVSGEIVTIYNGQMTFQSVKDAIESFAANPHSSGHNVPTVSNLEGHEQFEQFCFNTGKICVIDANSGKSPEFNETAKTNRSGPFKFFVVGHALPFEGMKNGFWVIHPKKEMAIYVSTIEDLKGALDEVVGGSAKWFKISELVSKSGEL